MMISKSKNMNHTKKILTELMAKDLKSEYGMPTTMSDYEKAIKECNRFERWYYRAWFLFGVNTGGAILWIFDYIL